MTRTIWITGLPGSGKSTLAHRLGLALTALGQECVLLDGDEAERGYTTAAHRAITLGLAEAAREANARSAYAIVAAVSPLSVDRAKARNILGTRKMLEVYLNTPLAVCERRDTRGLFARARAGELRGFTGLDGSYQVPRRPHVVLDTFVLSICDCESRILRALTPGTRSRDLRDSRHSCIVHH